MSTSRNKKGKFSVQKYARFIGFTQAALVNDDLGTLADFTRKFGKKAARVEAQARVDALLMAPKDNRRRVRKSRAQ